MLKKPFVYAFGASGYIVLVGIFINFVSHTQNNKPDTFLAPITFLSLLTLSVAVMAFFFFYQPLQFFIDGKKKQATSFFVQTLVIFAGITVAILVLLFSGLIR